MNDTSNGRSTSNTGLVLMGLAVGAVVGAGLALLLAPDSGKKTRQRLGAAAQGLSDRAGDTLEQVRNRAGDTLEQVRDTMTDLGVDAQSAVRAGKEAFLSDRAERVSHAAEHMSGTNAAKRSG